MRTFRISLFPAPLLLIFYMVSSCNPPYRTYPPESLDTWQQVLEDDLHLLGHRNWILVVDKAFPEQSSSGMKYIYVEQDLLPTLKYVLEEVESSTHVSPIIYQDKELSFITEEQVPGIGEFRSESENILSGRSVNSLLHDEVFSMLDESSSLFRVLVIIPIVPPRTHLCSFSWIALTGVQKMKRSCVRG